MLGSLPKVDIATRNDMSSKFFCQEDRWRCADHAIKARVRNLLQRRYSDDFDASAFLGKRHRSLASMFFPSVPLGLRGLDLVVFKLDAAAPSLSIDDFDKDDVRGRDVQGRVVVEGSVPESTMPFFRQGVFIAFFDPLEDIIKIFKRDHNHSIPVNFQIVNVPEEPIKQRYKILYGGSSFAHALL